MMGCGKDNIVFLISRHQDGNFPEGQIAYPVKSVFEKKFTGNSEYKKVYDRKGTVRKQDYKKNMKYGCQHGHSLSSDRVLNRVS
jgi:hypothetical protein